MDFRLSDTEKDIQQAAREFAEKEFPDVAREYDEKEEFPMPVWKKACELGFVGGFIKEEYGGPGLGFTEVALIMEEFWRVDPGMGNLILTAFGAEIIQYFGTEEQKKKYLPLVPSGKPSCCAITEPDAGAISYGITSRKGWQMRRINGKMFMNNGNIVYLAVVFCLTDQKSGNRYKRHSFFIVEKERKGFEASKLKGKMGIRASDTAELTFNNVRVPAENLIGEKENDGFKQVMHLFNINRLVAGASGVGVAQGAFEKAVKYVQQRKQFGKSIASNQGVQFMIAEMAAKIRCQKHFTACWLLIDGQVDPMVISM